VQWLRDTSKRLGVYLGAGFVEADGDDFFNSYALGTPDGRIAGFVRKTMAETNLFRCAPGGHVVVTEVGTIGIGICADNHFVPMVRLMRAQPVALMLMPHAAPAAFKTGGLVSKADLAGAQAKLRGLAPLYARLLGVPAVFANQVGPRGRERWPGILGALLPPDRFRFAGLSTVADLDGTIRGRLDDQREGVVVAEVTLDPARKDRAEPVRYGRYGGGWLHPGASGNLPRDVICSLDALLGRTAYVCSAERRRRARAVSSHAPVVTAGKEQVSPLG
jgi:N-carbamoylputrescine amidase